MIYKCFYINLYGSTRLLYHSSCNLLGWCFVDTLNCHYSSERSFLEFTALFAIEKSQGKF